MIRSSRGVAPPGAPVLAGILVVSLLAVWPLGARLAWADLWSASLLLALCSFYLVRVTLQGGAIGGGHLAAVGVGFCGWGFTQAVTGISVHPHGTVEGLVSIAALLGTMVTLNAVQTGRHRQAAATAVLATGIIVAVFAMIQHGSWNGRLFWFYDPPMGGTFPFGPFNNRNYYAGYMVAVTGPALGLALAPGRSGRRIAAASVFMLGTLTVLVSQSRGGVLALSLMALATMAGHSISARRRSGSMRRAAVVSVTTVVLVVGLGAALAATGQMGPVADRLATFANLTSDPSVGGRLAIWQDTLRMIGDRPLVGTGINTFVWGHLPYRSSPTGIPQHAHNEYLEIVAETGLIGGAICLAFLVLLWRTMIREYRRARTGFEIGLRLGAMASWLGIMIYAVTDFPTVIPATNYVLAILAGLACVPAAEAEATAARTLSASISDAETPADP